MDSKFTDKARKALRLSQEIATELGHNFVGTEHLLAALIKEGTSRASEALVEEGVTYDYIIENIKDEGNMMFGGKIPDGVLPLTPRTKTVIELSYSESQRTGAQFIFPEHILMAILREGESVAARLLRNLHIDPNSLVRKMFGTSATNQSKQNSTSNLKDLTPFGSDLTQMAAEGKFDPIIGRDQEIERVIQILSRRTKNNPCLIGEPGVGKTAIAEGLAQKIVAGEVPETLKGKKIFSLDLASMVAGTKYRGEFEERIRKALDEAKKSEEIILFIDEVHTLIGAGASEGAMDAANILKPLLARGELQVIGATTLDEYRKHIEKDSALERRFQPITVGEPTVEETVQILMGIRDKYEAHHKVRITDDAIESAAKLSQRYIADRFLPDKAIDLIDEASSRIRMKAYTAPPEVKSIEAELAEVCAQKKVAIEEENFEKAAQMRDKEEELKTRLDEVKGNWNKESNNTDLTVGSEEICDIISSWTGIPVKKLALEEQERLKNMENILHERVVGQDEAVTAVSKAIRRGRTGLKDPKRPIGSFVFLGPTGVGKTELCKAVAETVFGDENAVIRIDMSEYMDKHNVSRLVGSPPGFVGYDEGGQLTEKVRRKPYSVVLFDEIEKAHPDVFNILLQILEDGILTDSQGRRVDFKNTVIIMTSNIGARLITEKSTSMGFGGETADNDDYEKIKSSVLGELKKAFRPELLNRIDEIIVFKKLTKENITDITKIMLKNLKNRLSAMDVDVEFTEDVISHLAEEGFDPVYGARPLRRAIQSGIEDLISDEMLSGNVAEGMKVLVDFKDGKITVVKQEVE
ncbi:MAG: ATP-dependent Clp protease ATP-binding subunit [Ruminococcaceae bacterium]|nr:ATP-dependent Clp protease ATP-binding subunit [Oscillospiraceae bacterium]